MGDDDDNDKGACYSWEGTAYPNNTKCPDSDSCCSTTDYCRPDRLCNSADDSNEIIRALCFHRPWNLESCAQVCLYDRKNKILPRVNICPDGSYCCGEQPTCCLDKQGFFLHKNGTLKGRANETSPTSTTSTRTVGATTSPDSDDVHPISGVATGSIKPASSGGLSTSSKVGMGVGIPLGVLVVVGAIALTWFILRKKKKPPKGNQVAFPEQVPFPVYGGQIKQKPTAQETPAAEHRLPRQTHPAELSPDTRAPTELDASPASTPADRNQ